MTSEVLIGFPNGVFVPLVFAIIAPWWVGQQLRQRRRMVRELGARSRELEAEEDAFARLSVRRERARIARELHDIVAHHLAVIVIQAGAGRVADPNRMDEAAERFRSVRESGEQALAEMARLVDILHADDAHAPGTDRLQLLLESADANGLDVQVTPLPPGVQLPAEVEDAAYRVVQEGLTNVMKHAPGAEVEVRLGLRGDSFEIVVRNDSRQRSLAARRNRLGPRAHRHAGAGRVRGRDSRRGARRRRLAPARAPSRGRSRARPRAVGNRPGYLRRGSSGSPRGATPRPRAGG